ncbi:putative ubiquitin-protein ligase [Trypanosoma conorhini]|uniref:Putative ubiquitin-protein ligase n=1 Tax=Trypanosoma conorhini TaxID=83891 RepID=A0A422PJJ0_9TRYP|nr:putative ubiquitin-protein ligase [Trypanosoma conorhini]RNF17898.1 putative ubiquitin-protein ligase [Trypanosoma conorhini]
MESNMEDELGDWGLLSIADILDVNHFRKNEVLRSTILTLHDFEIPLLSCGPSYAARYIQMLIKNSKCNAENRNSNLEEIDKSRSVRLKQSLAASELIRERLLGAIELFALTVQQENHRPSFLQIVVHLGSVVCPAIGSFCDALIEGTEAIALQSISSPKEIGSCVEVLQLFRSRINMSVLTKEQQRRLFFAEFSLALRSERLGVVVNCLLQQATKDAVQGEYCPPPLEHRVSFVKAKTDGFLTRICELPFPVHSTQVSCFPTEERLVVCSGNRGCVFDQLGMMGTRFKLKEEFELPIEKNTRLILCNEKDLFLAVRLPSTMGNTCYSIQKCNRVSGELLAKSKILFLFDDALVASRDILFDIHGSVLSCLVCSESSRVSNSKCHLIQKDLDAIFDVGQHEFHVTPQSALKRGQGLGHATKKCYYFTKVNAISIGRVTLKENFHPFTVEMWVYPCNALENQSVLSLGDKSLDEVLIEIEPTPEGVLWRGGSRTPHLGASFVTFAVPGKLAFCQRWWHVALLFKGNSWELWVNDAIVARAPALVSPEALIDVECVLGKSFVGCLAEVRIWNCCRTPVQLCRDSRRSLTTAEPTLSGYFPLDESEGDVIADYAANGSHALLHQGQATWLAVDQFPIAPLNIVRCIDDFAPIAWRESSGILFLSSCPGYIAVAVPTEGPSLTICEYTTYDLRLVFQARVELPVRTPLKGMAYNALRHSLACYATTAEHPKRVLIWELHQQHYFPFLKKDKYENILECERDLLTQCAMYAKRLVGAERCLVDQLSWSVRVPGLVVDTSDGLISSLLRLIHTVLVEQKYQDYTRQLYALLHANLLCRVENQRDRLIKEIGDVFPDAQTLIKAAQGYSEATNTRAELLRLAFQESFFESGLLSMTCRCLLSEKSRLAFVKTQAGRGRITEKEDMLFRSLLDYYGSLQASSMLLNNTDNAQLFCSSLMAEEVFQVDRWLAGNGKALEAIRRTSHSLEVFQEILLAKAVEKYKGECCTFVTTYAKLLLRISERIMEVSSKALRKKPELYLGNLITCIECSAVGALLPSFTVALPLLPTSIQASCLPSLKSCREALFALTDALPRNEQLPYELGVALTSALCRIGCSLLVSSDVVTSEVELKYLHLLWGGIRKPGCERDAIIKNIQQGVGAISRVIDELHRDDPGALLVLRDDRLVKLERLLMAAFCALLIPTESLRQATRQTLAPMFRYVHNMRALVLSKRQENRESLDVLEEKATFLARFEPISGIRSEELPRLKAATKDASPQRKWKRFFQTWKALRVLKTKLPQQRETESGEPEAVILQFLWDKNVERESVDRLVLQQTQRAHYRLSGMLLLRQLIEEARASETLAGIVLPVLAKAFTGWHYSDDVQCCSKGDFLRLHGAFFQLLELAVVSVESGARDLWADVFLSLLTSELRVIDFRRVRSDVVTTLGSLWKFENRTPNGIPSLNGNIPEGARNTRLAASGAAPTLVIGQSGCTMKGLGGRGTCVVPVEWSLSQKDLPYYFEVLIVDIYPGGSCCVGVGPPDYSVSRLPGWDSESYALQSEEGTLHESNTLGRPTGCTFGIGDVMGCGWNTETREIYWTKNGKDIVASVEVAQHQLNPLIGMCGKGLLKVNFGAERFMFDKVPGIKPIRRQLGETAWDVFRVLSLRAALGLVESCGASQTHNADSTEGLRTVVEQCIESSCAEVERVLALPMSESFVISLCSHLATLAKVLVSANDEALTPCVQRVVMVLQRITHHTLQGAVWSSKLRCVLLRTWFAFMNLVHPHSITEDDKLPGFLDTLLALGREIEWAVSQCPGTTSEACTSAEAWTALAFLQHINCNHPPHRWRDKLHAWIMRNLETPKDKANTSLALRILFGAPRLLVPGDRIVVQKSKHKRVTAILIDYSLDEETCEIIEDEEKRQTISLRQTDITMGDDSVTFPQTDNKFHEEQVAQVLRLAQRIWGETGVDTGLTGTALRCKVLAILWRCVRRGVLVAPSEILPMLAKFCDSGENFLEEHEVLAQERLVIEHCLLGRVLSGSSGGSNAAGAVALGSSDGRELRTRLAQELSMRGYNLDLCFVALDETNNDVQLALQLLGDHHGDFMSTRRRAASSSSEDEDMSSDDAEIDAAEYDLHVLFPAESDEGMDEEVSVDHCDPSLCDGIRFIGGYVCVAGERALGHKFTIDLQLYLFDSTATQVVFHQKALTGGSRLVAHIRNSTLYCGWMKTGDDASQLCKFPLQYTDTLRWIQLTVVQDASTFSFYKAGVLQSEMTLAQPGAILENELYFGGSAESEETHFSGGMKNVQIFGAALTREEVANLSSFRSWGLPPHPSLSLVCASDTIKAVSRGTPYTASVTVVGAVTWFEQAEGGGRPGDFCQHEIDFTTQNGEDGIFSVDTVNEASSFTTLWRRRKDQRKDYLLTSILKLDRQLACYYAVAILTQMMRLTPNAKSFLTREQTRNMVRLTVNSLDADLLQSLSATLQHLTGADDGNVVNYAMEELVDMVQREQKMLVFESSHPFKSTSETAHEVYVPGRHAYELYFDARCSSSSVLVTFYADHTLSSIIAQTPGYALHTLLIRAPRFFFDVRMDASTPQWGYKVVVLYDASVPRSAARLLHATLSAVIARGMSRVQFLKTGACLEALANASRMNVGTTRRIVLSCLTDILTYGAEYIEPMPHANRMHDLRRMAERLFRRTIGSQHLQSRFVQVVAEFYVALKDAEHCWRVIGDERAKIRDEVYDAGADTESFVQKRLEQRRLYRRREGMRVTVEKVLHPESLRIGVNPNKTILVWSERSGSSVVADVPLGSGKWYFEVRMMATGDVFVGVLPSRLHDWSDVPTPETFLALNGKTGTFHGVKDDSVAPRRIWKAKDYVGVVMDGAKKTCSFFVNGCDTGLCFRFAASEAEAVCAAGTNLQDELEMSYYPFFVLEEEEGVTINFGGAHFEFESPRDCFPFDPANLSLGTLIPYNQLRAFHDLATYIVSAGRTTLPTFFHEEANPFDGSTERFGPPHVSLHSAVGVQINLLLVRNTGTRFATVRANCRVSGGKWYYEVTLRSQGLIQIGWASSDDPQTGGVGDTPNSWSIDLFRRLKWHNGKCETLTASRRWVVGDVIGCALDIVERKMIFLCNGRPLCDATLNDCTFAGLPTTLSYEPAVSLRAGNEVLFNFGSSSFKYKPEGFCALGVPDSWNERMDAFYSTLRPSTTLLRLRALSDIWLSTDKFTIRDRLKPYSLVVDAIQQYCRREGKSFAQVTEEVCTEIFRDVPIPAQEAWKAYTVLVAFSRVSQTVIPFLHLDTRHLNISTKLFLECRGLLFASLRNDIVDDILRVTNVRAEHLRVSINRLKARANKGSWMSTVFGQTFSLLADQHPRAFRTNKRLWGVVFLGEGSEDVGGPFREHIGEMCRELMSTSLPLFVPTANNVHNTGNCRDAFVPAASAVGTAELTAFVFIGQLMGGAMRNNEPLGLFFPPIVWKFLCFYPIEESDIDDVDRICLQCIREFRGLKNRVGSGDMFDEVFDAETFTTRLSDGSIKELIPGGSTTRVTLDRCEEYADALSAARLGECTRQLEKIRDGLLSVIPETVLCLLTASELEFRICGKPDYAVEELRDGAVYEGLTSDDRRVQFLWQALEDATPLQRRLFLRFVSGRDRLPVKLRVLPLSTPGDADSALPRAATCFFALELPDYSSVEVLKAKLYYSIENCADIDTDFNPREVDESEAPQLMVGLEDTRQEEVDSATLSD